MDNTHNYELPPLRPESIVQIISLGFIKPDSTVVYLADPSASVSSLYEKHKDYALSEIERLGIDNPDLLAAYERHSKKKCGFPIYCAPIEFLILALDYIAIGKPYSSVKVLISTGTRWQQPYINVYQENGYKIFKLSPSIVIGT